MMKDEKYVTSEGFKARVATIEDVRESFEETYSGKAICILWSDGSDSMIHDNGYTLEECEKAYSNGGIFFFDENLFQMVKKLPLKILIIEDNDYKFENIAHTVEKLCSCVIDRAESRNSGLSKIRDSYLKNEPYNILFCDNYLPIYDHGQEIMPRAAEIIQYIRHRGYHLPICLCSSESIEGINANYYLHYDSSVYLGGQVIEILTEIVGEMQLPNKNNGGRTNV